MGDEFSWQLCGLCKEGCCVWLSCGSWVWVDEEHSCPQLSGDEQEVWMGEDSVASNPGFPFRILSRSFGEKSEGKPGRISHVIGGTVVTASTLQTPETS